MKALAVVLGLFVTLAASNPIRAGEPNPGLKAVADASTDIVVAEVLDTKPRKAKEGARDTAQLKVIRALKGPLGPGDEVGVYYHLLWVDTEKWVLEAPKFEKGKRYTVFLVNSQGYTLTDQWLAVLPEHPQLDKEVAQGLLEGRKTDRDQADPDRARKVRDSGVADGLAGNGFREGYASVVVNR